MGAGAQLRLVQAVRDGVVERLVDQRPLARAGDAGDAAEDPERDVDVDVLEVVLAGAADEQRAARLRGAPPGTSIVRLPERYWPVGEAGSLAHLSRGARGDDVAAVDAGAGPDLDEVVGGHHRVLVVLDHDHRVAEVAQALERRDQLLVVALVQADRGLVEHVQHAHQARPDLGRQADPLRLAAGERARRRASIER